ncbi:MAG: hypothetical protein MUE61_00800 [Vicinamibacterales bacterium]|nr:hypothetical protein [Vicinamibacterales bacterium]
MATAVVGGRDLDVLGPEPPIHVLVLEARIGKLLVAILLRNVVCKRP